MNLKLKWNHNHNCDQNDIMNKSGVSCVTELLVSHDKT